MFLGKILIKISQEIMLISWINSFKERVVIHYVVSWINTTCLHETNNQCPIPKALERKWMQIIKYKIGQIRHAFISLLVLLNLNIYIHHRLNVYYFEISKPIPFAQIDPRLTKLELFLFLEIFLWNFVPNVKWIFLARKKIAILISLI